MQLYSVLVLMVTLSAVSGLRCYSCRSDQSSCPTFECPAGTDHCATALVKGVTFKNCIDSAGCTDSVKCCSKDLCNGATTTGSRVLLMLVASAIFTVFL